jgi:hypothetical protein
MRTTIEIDEEHRARLLELAARRKLKGFSTIVQEALDFYLSKGGGKTQPGMISRQFRGILVAEKAEHYRKTAARIRSSWR